MLVAMNIEDMLLELGHEVAGIASRLDAALALAKEGAFDLALLDVNLAGQPSFPIAAALRERGVPFLFATGYGLKGIIEEFKASPVLQKPFSMLALGQAVRGAAAAGQGDG